MTVWQLLALIGILTAGALAIICRRADRGRTVAHETATRIERLLDSAPIGLLRHDGAAWRANDAAAALLTVDPAQSLDDGGIAARFAVASRDEIHAGLQGLGRDGRPFELTAATQDGGQTLSISGRADASGASVWLNDQSAAAWLAGQFTAKEEEATLLRAVLDAVPAPIWWRRDSAGPPIGGNRAFLQAQDSAGGGPLRDLGSTERARDLVRLAQRTGLPQSESRHLVLDGARRSVDVTETPVDGANPATAGIAQDKSDLEDLQTTLAEHVAVQDQVLERLTAAIAIYGPDRRLKFANEQFARMFRIPADVLDQQPSMNNLLEFMRERRQLPEASDWAEFKREREAMFTGLIEPVEDLMHLPDGRTIKRSVAPHPLGGLIFQYDDVTDRLVLESSYNTLIAVQRSTLDSLFEGVAVFGRDGRLKLSNRTYATAFGFSEDWLASEPHVSELTDRSRNTLRVVGDWENIRRKLIYKVSEPRAEHGRMNLLNGRVFDYAYVPLPDGQCLMLYYDVTDSTQVEAALRERNRALENADLLKSRFVSSVSYELRTPLNAISGFAELLRLKEFGTLSDRQMAYVDDILEASGILSLLVSDILDLAAVQAGFMELERHRVDLVEILSRESTALNDGNRHLAKIQLTLPDAPMVIDGDARRLAQAIRYLLNDAARFAVSDAAVDIKVEPGAQDAVRMMFHVRPNNLDETTWPTRVLGTLDLPVGSTPPPTGRDIGLSLARSLLQAHAADLSVGDDAHTLICTFPAQN